MGSTNLKASFCYGRVLTNLRLSKMQRSPGLRTMYDYLASGGER
jgi:hypothetical protein